MFKSVFLFLAFVLCSTVVWAADGDSSGGDLDAYIEAKTADARRLGLANEPAWLRLGHYRETAFGGFRSEADGAGFFLADDGKTNPEAELVADLRGMYAPAIADVDGQLQHPRCRFPARVFWLAAMLDLDMTRIRQTDCTRLDAYLQRIRPTSVSLVFSSYYLNNPSSAFGHTFLRFYQGDPSSAEKKREIVDYAIDFSADVDTNNAIIYSFKGLTGMFPGTFKRYPYYYKVREYNDSESRDLWEYELDLNPVELAMVTAHLWELGSTYFDYYYLTENCSYHILGALEAANPNLHLLAHNKFPVLPVDTVKALFKNAGLVRDIFYRPSVRTQFRRRIQDLNGPERRMTAELLAEPNKPFPPDFTEERQRLVLDATADLIEYLWGRELIYKEDSDAARLKQIILERRAAIRVPSPMLDTRPTDREKPQLGHDSWRIGLGDGIGTNGGFIDADVRMAMHDLLDPVTGYPELMQLEFAPTRVRFEPDENRVTLEDTNLVRIVSLTPVDRFDHRISWKFRAGATTPRDEYCETCTAGVLEMGAGATFADENQRLVFYAMGDVRFLTSTGIDGFKEWDAILGGGPSAGLRVRFADGLIALTQAQWLIYPYQGVGQSWDVGQSVRWSSVKNRAIELTARARPRFTEIGLLLYVYF